MSSNSVYTDISEVELADTQVRHVESPKQLFVGCVCVCGIYCSV